MKKTISIILSFIIVSTTLSIGFTAYADVLEQKSLESFIENTCDVIQEIGRAHV